MRLSCVSCGPSLRQPDTLHRRAPPLVLRGPDESERGVEVVPVVLPVAALVGAAAAAQTVNRRPPGVVARVVQGVPRWRGGGAVSRRRNRF